LCLCWLRCGNQTQALSVYLRLQPWIPFSVFLSWSQPTTVLPRPFPKISSDDPVRIIYTPDWGEPDVLTPCPGGQRNIFIPLLETGIKPRSAEVVGTRGSLITIV
jgi:hypothetical protein